MYDIQLCGPMTSSYLDTKTLSMDDYGVSDSLMLEVLCGIYCSLKVPCQYPHQPPLPTELMTLDLLKLSQVLPQHSQNPTPGDTKV